MSSTEHHRNEVQQTIQELNAFGYRFGRWLDRDLSSEESSIIHNAGFQLEELCEELSRYLDALKERDQT